MARLGRYFVPDRALHVIQRGNDRKAVFFDDGDFTHYRDWPIAASKANRLAVQAGAVSSGVAAAGAQHRGTTADLP